MPIWYLNTMFLQNNYEQNNNYQTIVKKLIPDTILI